MPLGIREQHATLGAVPTGRARDAPAGLGARREIPILASRARELVRRLGALGTVRTDRTGLPMDRPVSRLVVAVATGRTRGAVILFCLELAFAGHTRRGHAETRGAVVSNRTGYFRPSRLPSWTIVLGGARQVRLRGIRVWAVQGRGTRSTIRFLLAALDCAVGTRRTRLWHASSLRAIIPNWACPTRELHVVSAAQLRSTISSGECVCRAGHGSATHTDVPGFTWTGALV